MKISRSQRVAIAVIVLGACILINYLLYEDVKPTVEYLFESKENEEELSSLQLQEEQRIRSIISSGNDKTSNSSLIIPHFINKAAIPYYPDIWNKTPWNSFDLNIPKIILRLRQHNKSIKMTESVDLITPEPKELKLEYVNWDTQVKSHYMTCNNLSLQWKYPIGIPQIGVSSTSQFDLMYDENNYQKLKETDFSQLIDFDALCMVHTPGFHADNAIFNRESYYGFTYMWMGNYGCWAGKTIDLLCDTSLNTCSNQGILSYLNVYNKPTTIINIAFRLTGWGADAFSHFHIFVIPQFGMIYNILVDLKKKSMTKSNIDAKIPIFYNISLITHADKRRRKSDIRTWFFNQFGLKMMDTTMVTTYMNISIVLSKSWCKLTNSIHWSPLLISPHFLRYREKYNGAITMHWKLVARNTMLNIKPFITNMSVTRDIVLYMDRGRSSRRGVKNNDEVVNAIRKFVNDNTNRLPFKFQKFSRMSNRDKEKDYLSRVALMIGPHGGAFANINIMQPGSYILEFIDWWSDSVTLTNDKREKFRPCMCLGIIYYYLYGIFM